MKEQLEKIKQEALAALAVTKESVDLEALRVKYLGKKGELTAVLKQMGKLSAEERPVIGQLANEVRERLTAEIDAQKKKIEEIKLEARLEAEAVDVTIPGQRTKLGHQHPMYIALDEIKDIFVGMGFTILDGPEVELAYYNFDRLNAEEGHLLFRSGQSGDAPQPDLSHAGPCHGDQASPHPHLGPWPGIPEG